MSETLENLLHGDAAVRAAGRPGRGRQRHGRRVRRGRRGPARLLGGAGRPADLGQAVGPGAGLVQPAVRQVVRRRRAQRRLQLRRPARRGRPRRQGRHPLGGRARATPAPSPTPTCSARSARPPTRCTELGVRPGRPGRDLPADDPRGRGRDAGLRPDRRDALAWSSAASPPTRSPAASRTPDAKLVITADGGYRRGEPSRAQADRGRGRRRVPEHRARAGGAPHRPGRRLDRASDVWWHDDRRAGQRRAHRRSRSTPSTRCSSSTPRARPVSPRASCTPPAAT